MKINRTWERNQREEITRPASAKLERPMPAVRITASTQGLILGVADAMVMHAARARKAIDWHTFHTWPNSPKMKPIQKDFKKKGHLTSIDLYTQKFRKHVVLRFEFVNIPG